VSRVLNYHDRAVLQWRLNQWHYGRKSVDQERRAGVRRSENDATGYFKPGKRNNLSKVQVKCQDNAMLDECFSEYFAVG